MIIMEKNIDYISAREMLLEYVKSVGTERVPLEESLGRILARELCAEENVPSFDRSPYDGYALRACDTAAASQDAPVTLRILEEIAAGSVPHFEVTEGTAVKILTGAPIPPGADAVVMYEKTHFTKSGVTVFSPLKSGENIVRAGEDVRAGTVLAIPGTVIDAGLCGTLAAQGVTEPEVYMKPVAGIISTGSEVVEIGGEVPEGKIRNSNRYTLSAALRRAGCETLYLGHADDRADDIAGLVRRGCVECDAVFLTGGVSVGDYDLTPEAMERADVTVLFRGVSIKPGMACAYGVKALVPVCALSGNPASSMTNFYAVALPAVRKLCGRAEVYPEEITVTLESGFKKKSPCFRLLRGRLSLADGTVRMRLSQDQGNVVISSAVGCNAMAIVPAGSGPLEPGTQLKGFLI